MARDLAHPEQIPLEELRRMTTAEVVERVLANPLVGHILSYDSIQQGIDDITNNNHLFMELLRREDAGQVLVERYRGMDPAVPRPDWLPAERANFYDRLAYTEVLLSHDDLLAALPEEERRALLAEALRKYEHKCDSGDAVCRSGRLFTTLLIGRTLRHQHYPEILQAIEDDDAMEDFLRHGDAAVPWVEQKILEMARAYLQQSSKH